MEPHKTLPVEVEKYRPDLQATPRAYYEAAMDFAEQFYGEEMRRISSTKFDEVTPDFFFNEYVWVVHATGFSAKAVGKFMPRLVEAYGPWHRLGAEKDFTSVFGRVRQVVNNGGKAMAVHNTARLMRKELVDGGVPWEDFRAGRLSAPKALAKLPYIGPVTCYHLGRNIGLLDCVKPDLHLVRMAEHWGFADCVEMCKEMRGDDNVPLGIVDLALWYAASTFGTLDVKKAGSR